MMQDLPALVADASVAADYTAARLRHWCARSSRGLEVLRYRQGAETLRHPALQKGPAFLRRLDDVGLTEGPTRDYWERNLICNEGSVRERLRRPLAELFRPARVARLRSEIDAIIDRVLDEVEDLADVDFMAAVAWRVPAQVYCLLVGAPLELAPQIAHLSDTILAPILTVDRSRLQESIDAVWQSRAFVEAHLAARRAAPGDDFASWMIRQQEEGLLTEEELVIQSMALLQASIDNTVHQLGLSFGTLLENPDRWKAIVARPQATAAAVEETFRLRPRFGTIFRYAAAPVRIDDVTIPGDSWVYVSTRSAGRDETMFDAADSFKLDRSPVRPLMFGGGSYDCLGQTLARLELAAMVGAIRRRFPGIRLADTWRTFDTNAVSETAHLRVSLT